MPAKKIKAKEAFQALKKIYNQPRFADVLQELDTNPKARAAAKKDARAYFVDQGIKLPEEATVLFSGNTWKVSICFLFFCFHFEHS